MVEKERMQPFWYQGNLIDPNEELPFPLEQLVKCYNKVVTEVANKI